MPRRTRLALSLFTALVLVWAGCGDADTDDEAAAPAEAPPTAAEPVASAVADLQPTEGSEVTGRVTLTPNGTTMQVVADVQNLSEGMHGFHIHENGACGPGEDGTPGGAAGGHFNPEGTPHGAPSDPADEHHIGDMGNIQADASGRAQVDTSFAFLSFDGDASVVGKAIVIHAGRDDMTSQPSGAAGNRVACGVIYMEGEGAM